MVNDNDLMYLVWDHLYRVAVPDILTASDTYLKHYGSYVTGDNQVDQMLRTNYSNVMLPLSTIIGYVDQGFDVKIYSRDDMLKMYKDIRSYLIEYDNIVAQRVNQGNVPYKDLIMMDNFASMIYHRASLEELVDLSERKTSMDTRLTFLSGLRPRDASVIHKEKPDYNEMASIFKKRMREYGRTR